MYLDVFLNSLVLGLDILVLLGLGVNLLGTDASIEKKHKFMWITPILITLDIVTINSKLARRFTKTPWFTSNIASGS